MADNWIPIRDLKEAGDRVQSLANRFMETFNRQPALVIRVPGRVNLIGEHIDYCGYGVLPMAIERDILIAAAINDSKEANQQHELDLRNVDSNQFPDIKLDANSYKINVPPTWSDYFLCGHQGTKETLASGKPMVSLDLLVEGTVPPSSGLSSSSALVCAGLLTSYACQLLREGDSLDNRLSKEELAHMAAGFERYIGTEGGGMDQAIALMARKGAAKLIQFRPSLSGTDVFIPSECVFVVAHCGATMNKAATSYFNTRVIETRLAAAILAKANGLPALSPPNRYDYYSVMEKLGKSLDEMPLVVEQFLKTPSGCFKIKDVAEYLELDETQLIEQFSTRIVKLDQIDSGLKLYQRSMHVYQEAERVVKFANIADETVRGDNTTGAGDQASCIQRLGALMNESHDSCRRLYECSCDALDNLVELQVNKLGAIGARLTGAGWGGCTVALVPQSQADDFLAKLQTETKLAFASKPNEGAVIYSAAS